MAAMSRVVEPRRTEADARVPDVTPHIPCGALERFSTTAGGWLA